VRNFHNGVLRGVIDLSERTALQGASIESLIAEEGHLIALVAAADATAFEIFVVDTTHVGNPLVQGPCRLSTSPGAALRAIRIEGGLLAILMRDGQTASHVDVVDILSGLSATDVSRVNLPGVPTGGLSIENGYVYGDTDAGLFVVDARDPADARLVFLDPNEDGSLAQVARGRVLYAAHDYEMRIFDISEPRHPVYIASSWKRWPTTGAGLVEGNRVLYGLRYWGVEVLPYHSGSR
jgi:hypothetical protein